MISTHAKEQVFHRYGIIFSGKRWRLFLKSLHNGKNSVRLHDNRIICRFEDTWFLLVYENETVITFLPQTAIKPEEKRILHNDTLYRAINDDVFGVWPRNSQVKEPDPFLPVNIRKRIAVDDIAEEELPSDFYEAEELLK